MNKSESEKQISRMCAFIKQEASEKVNEINLKTEQERDKQLNILGIEGRQAIDAEYERMMKDLNKKKRVMKAKASQKELVRKFVTRDKLLDILLEGSHDKLTAVSQGGSYKALCQKLLVQGLVKLMEKDVKVKCRQADVGMIKGVLEAVAADYKRLFKEQCGLDLECKLRLDDQNFLKADSAGGVVLMGHGNKIVCNNTLDARLKLCFEDLKPVVRSALFPSSMSVAR